MKGVVFTVFNEYVEDTFGIPMWERLLRATDPPSCGFYTTGQSYDDGELLALLGELAQRTKRDESSLLRDFGAYMLRATHRLYPEFFNGHDARSFLRAVDAHIHVEVLKLFPDAVLPRFSYSDEPDGTLVMRYESGRKLCALAEGLIDGAAAAFGVKIAHQQRRCMHRGDDCCEFHIRIGAMS